MIKVEGYYDYTADAESQLSRFKNNFIRMFWDQAPDIAEGISKEDYFKMNRAMGAAVDKMIDMVSVKKEHCSSVVESFKGDLDEVTISEMSQMMSRFIMETTSIPVKKQETYLGGTVYTCSIPFIKYLPPKGMNNNARQQ